MCSLYVPCLCAFFMSCFNVLFVFSLFMHSFYVFFLWALYICSFYALFLCALSMCSFDAVILCGFWIHSFYALSVFAIVMCCLYSLFSCALFICSFYTHPLCSLFMCSFGVLLLCSLFIVHAKKVLMHTSKYGRWQDGGPVKEVKFIWSQSKIPWGKDINWCCFWYFMCVRQNSFETMVKYDLKIRNFFNISDDQLDSDVLALPNHYQFCGETILRKLLIGRGITIQHYQFRDSMHSICKVGIQSRRKCRLKEGYITQKRANHLWHIDTNHKLVE